MAARLRFLLGRAGSGKTLSCLQAIRRELLTGPDGPPLILLTPEQATFQMERALLASSQVRATHRAHVLSFQRLAARVMQATGLGAQPLMGELGKRMVLRALIYQYGSQLAIFGKAARQPGFLDKLANTLTELRAYRCGPEDLEARQALLADGPNRVLAAKLHDLTLIYRAFAAYVEGRFTDPDELLNVVAAHLGESGVVTGARVWIDGFMGFTPQEVEVLRAIWRAAERVEIALCLDPATLDDIPGGPSATGGGYAPELDLFAPTRETYGQLLALAREDGLEVEPPRVLSPGLPPRFVASPALASVERQLFGRRRLRPAAAGDGGGAVKLVAAVDARAEVEAAAREILRLARERGWRYRDMAVIVRELETYQDLIAAVFSHFNIPYFIDTRRSLSHHPLTELVRSALEAAATGWPTDAVVRCLKTDLLPISRDEADRLENYALEHGIDGAAWVRDEHWAYVRRYTLDSTDERVAETARRSLEEINGARSRALRPLRRLAEGLKASACARDMAAAVWDFLDELGVAALLEAWIEEAEAAGRPEEVQEHTRAWQGLLQILDELVAAMGDRPLSVAEFRQIVEAGLESLRIGLVPPGLDQVLVGAVERSRQPDIKAAFVLGVVDGSFPKRPTEDVIFNDRERELLAESRLALSPTSRAVLVREQYLMYISLTRASEFLWVSWPTADKQGREVAPSFVVRRLRELFPDLKVQTAPVEPTSDDGWLDRVVDAQHLAALLAARLRRHRSGEQASPLWWSMYQWAARDPVLRRRAEGVFAALSHHNAVPPLPPNLARALFGSPLRTSVTRLESFAACPFQHFAAYGLGLRERPEWRLDRLQTGIFLHAALRRFVETLAERGADWGQLDDEEARALADGCVDALLPALGGELMLSSSRYAFLGEVLRRIVRRAVWALTEHARRGRFRPAAVEMAFGRTGAAWGPWVLELPGGQELHVRGQIDRVDVAQDDAGRLWVRVIDYKSSERDLVPGRVVHGLTLQLPVYLAVALQHGTELARAAGLSPGTPVNPAGALYFPVREPLLKRDAPVDGLELDALLRRQLRMRGLFIDEPDVLELMDVRVGGVGSDLLMVRVNKDGRVSRTSNTASLDDFAALANFVRLRVRALAGKVLSGEIAVAPYRLTGARPCSTCPYRSVCQFDPLIEGNGYRDLPSLGRQEAWERIRAAAATADASHTAEAGDFSHLDWEEAPR
ncbi:MAG: helicase-exonuclease AddAB subunit AddB [Firmicutes bacterium ZCTH02-B6]|nr:MAG: helicase-exonuclease AddAB subunit AddB [Firmicutes bacterium ZCTH02-B6]